MENDNRISFLDVMVKKCNNNNNSFSCATSVYRKQTYSGLGTSYFSFSPLLYKINAIKTLLCRAYKLSSSYFALSEEMTYLLFFFVSNGYPRHLIELHFKVFLNNIFTPKALNQTVLRKCIYIKFPYFGLRSMKLEKDINSLVSKYYPQLIVKFAFTNSYKIKSLLPNAKESLPVDLQSKIIYLYQCGACNGTYIGCSIRLLRVRICEHLGISPRTNRPITSPKFSAPKAHSISEDHVITKDNFSIIASTNNPYDLKILESLYIHTEKPSLNRTLTSYPLLIAQ